MMLIFLTFGMLVFLHESRLVSISLAGYLTWFLKIVGLTFYIWGVNIKDRNEKPHSFELEWGLKLCSYFFRKPNWAFSCP